MRKAGLLLFLIFLGSNLTAQGVSLDALSEARKAVAFDPTHISKRLNLAWNLMLAEQYEEALIHYRLVSSRDSLNIDAATGLLWSLSALNRDKDLIEEANTLLERMPQAGSLYYYRGLARLRLGKANWSRLDQKLALDLARDEFWTILAAQALSQSYQALGDIPAARAVLKIHTPYVTIPKPRRSVSFEVTAGAKKDSTYIIAAGASVSLGAGKLGVNAEELRLGSRHFRWLLRASLQQQFRYLDLVAGVKWLDGEDARIYPALGARLGLTAKIYAGPLILKPQIGQSVLLAERLNSYQSDAGLKLVLSPFSLSYRLSRIYLDTDIMNADTANLVHTAEAGFISARGWELSLYGASGSMAFHITPHGGVIDDFDPAQSYAGASIYAPIGKRVGLLLYGQLSFPERLLSLRRSEPASSCTPFYYLRGSYRV